MRQRNGKPRQGAGRVRSMWLPFRNCTGAFEFSIRACFTCGAGPCDRGDHSVRRNGSRPAGKAGVAWPGGVSWRPGCQPLASDSGVRLCEPRRATGGGTLTRIGRRIKSSSTKLPQFVRCLPCFHRPPPGLSRVCSLASRLVRLGPAVMTRTAVVLPTETRIGTKRHRGQPRGAAGPGVFPAHRCGGCEIRTREALPPTRFPSVRPRPLGESSVR
jgi:hypothetical protein